MDSLGSFNLLAIVDNFNVFVENRVTFNNYKRKYHLDSFCQLAKVRIRRKFNLTKILDFVGFFSKI